MDVLFFFFSLVVVGAYSNEFVYVEHEAIQFRLFEPRKVISSRRRTPVWDLKPGPFEWSAAAALPSRTIIDHHIDLALPTVESVPHIRLQTSRKMDCRKKKTTRNKSKTCHIRCGFMKNSMWPAAKWFISIDLTYCATNCNQQSYLIIISYCNKYCFF